MQEPIGFEWQPVGSRACGKYSLRHALLTLGIPTTRNDATRTTRLPAWITMGFGTDLPKLQRGLQYFRCRGIQRVSFNTDKLRLDLDYFLGKGCPVILTVQRGYHWVVICGKESENRYYWIDSSDDELIGYWTFSNIVDWIDSLQFRLFGVVPYKKRQLSHSLVPKWSEVYALLDDEDLCDFWGYYLEDLNDIFDSPPDSRKSLKAKEFFQRFEEIIFNATNESYLYSDAAQLKWEMNNYKSVADAHSLTLSTTRLPEAIARLSADLTCISCTGG